MGTQSLSLKWNSHQRNLVDVFEQLLWNEDLVDVTLACEGVTLKAHKTLLSACSPFFHTLFLEHPCKHPVIIMKDIKYADLKCIIEFMYKGEIIVPQDRLTDFLKTAETLKVKGLTESPCHQTEDFHQQQENISSQPQTSYTTADETHLEHNSSSQKKRKRTRAARRGSLNDVSDDEHQSNSKDAHYHTVPDGGKTIIECNSSDVSQERISVTQNLHEDTISIQKELPPTFDGSLIDAPSNIEISNLLDSHVRKENVQILPSSELLPPEIGPANSEPLNPSSVAVCTLDTATSSSRSISQELRKDIKPVSLMTFQEPPISYEAGPSHRDKNLAVSCIKFESLPDTYAECEQLTEKEPSQGGNNLIRKSAESTVCDVVLSQRGRTKINVNGYLMLRNKTRNNSFYWCCDKKISLQCPGRATTQLIAELYPSATRFMNATNCTFMDKSSEVIQASYLTTDLWRSSKQSRISRVNQSASIILKRTDKKASDRIHICTICHKRFDYKCRLMLHLRAHSSERPFSCDKCDKTFKRRNHYKSHQRIHHDVI